MRGKSSSDGRSDVRLETKFIPSKKFPSPLPVLAVARKMKGQKKTSLILPSFLILCSVYFDVSTNAVAAAAATDLAPATAASWYSLGHILPPQQRTRRLWRIDKLNEISI